MWIQFLQKIIDFLSSIVERHSPARPATDSTLQENAVSQEKAAPHAEAEPPVPTAPSPYPPKSIEDFISIIRHTPKSVLSTKDRARISAIMSFDDKVVADIMAPKSQIIFVKNTDVLGPLALDKLYQSGLTHFPVINYRKEVLGILHTASLNSLETHDTLRADKVLDPSVKYLTATTPLKTIAKELADSSTAYYLVQNSAGQLVGFFTPKMLLDYFLA